MGERRTVAVGEKYIDRAEVFRGPVRYKLGADTVNTDVVAVNVGKWTDSPNAETYADLITTHDAALSLTGIYHFLTPEAQREKQLLVVQGFDNQGIVQNFSEQEAEALAQEINNKLALMRRSARYS